MSTQKRRHDKHSPQSSTVNPRWLNRFQTIGYTLGLMVLSLATLLSSACSSVPKTDFKDRLAIGESQFGDTFEFFYIPSNGWLADRAFVQQSKHTTLSSVDAKRLSNIMANGEERLTQIAVSSPSAEKAQRILLEACQILRVQRSDQPLPFLEVMYIGKPQFSREIKECFGLLGSKYFFSDTDLELNRHS
ncbi:hypothetical protein [Marinibactrum halimedae]|uniref:Uncharacterized protein n=1 Tax=Marinibactrum halimedae TaxID=1444977 RepID=A0AA37T4U4_9GAMM|nr:hypothetical protein [Marinibactrum halimedae]MCD9459917.1 hypothetical protein [Marinibactrum halimedae]GLS25228.1 hypothetical protein GCM10007877_09420 [Marinibactrum halimedae]